MYATIDKNPVSRTIISQPQPQNSWPTLSIDMQMTHKAINYSSPTLPQSSSKDSTRPMVPANIKAVSDQSNMKIVGTCKNAAHSPPQLLVNLDVQFQTGSNPSDPKNAQYCCRNTKNATVYINPKHLQNSIIVCSYLTCSGSQKLMTARIPAIIFFGIAKIKLIKMTIYSFYIFHSSGECLFQEIYHSSHPVNSKLLFGLIFSLTRFASQISPKPTNETAFYGYQTPNYKLHILQTLSGLKFVMITDTNHSIKVQILEWIYSTIFTEFVIRNPFYVPAAKIESTIFKDKLRDYLSSIST